MKAYVEEEWAKGCIKIKAINALQILRTPESPIKHKRHDLHQCSTNMSADKTAKLKELTKRSPFVINLDNLTKTSWKTSKKSQITRFKVVREQFLETCTPNIQCIYFKKSTLQLHEIILMDRRAKSETCIHEKRKRGGGRKLEAVGQSKHLRLALLLLWTANQLFFLVLIFTAITRSHHALCFNPSKLALAKAMQLRSQFRAKVSEGSEASLMNFESISNKRSK